MKYRNILSILLLGFTLIAFQSCVKDSLEETVTTIGQNSQQIFVTSTYGRILTESGEPIAGADVQIKIPQGIQRYVTDDNGYFEFIRYENPGFSAFIKVNAPGYFEGFRRVSAIRNNYNYTQIRLLEKEIVDEFSNAVGGTASTDEGMQVTLPANSVMRANGTAYEGDIHVAMAWINPASSDLSDLMVGDLSGASLEGQEVTLASFGMANIELLDDNGVELQLREGVEATLSFPVPSERLAAAPSIIRLWSYDELDGTWVEETLANLEGDRYVGQVTHFSSWNVDFLMDPIIIDGCVQIQNNARAASIRAQVLVCSDLIGQKGGWLCPDGKFQFYNFPKGEEFLLKIVDECGNTIYEETYGPFDANTDIGIINIDLPTTSTSTITGMVTDCNGNTVTEGNVKIETDNGNKYFVPINNGSFTLDILLCTGSTEATITAFDYVNLKMSPATTITLTPGLNDVGTLVACDELDEFLTVNIDNYVDYLNIDPSYNGGDSTNITANESNDSIEYLEFRLLDFSPAITGTGTYQSETHWFQYFIINGENLFTRQVDPADMEVEITQYGPNAGDIIRGTYSGMVNLTVDEVDQGVHEMYGEFKIIRD